MSRTQKQQVALPDSDKVTTVVQFDGIDALMFDSIRHARKISELCQSNDGEGITQDAFTSFFSHEPLIKEEADPVQSGILEQMMGLPEFGSLRAGSKNDEVASALGAASFAPEMITKLRELRQKMKERQEQAKKDGKPIPQNLKDALSDQEMSGLRQSLRKALEKAQEESDKWTDTAQAWGTGTQELKKIPIQKRMELADTMANTKKLQRIADLAGRFKNIVNSSSSTVPVHGLDEVVDIGISDDIGHMLPSELIKLIETPDQFAADLFEKKLLTYNLKGIEPLGRGPIIVCQDMSGSMNGPRDEWAKAVALALLQLAIKQKRAFGFIGFDDRVKFQKFFPRNSTVTIEQKIELATMFSGGGTNFYDPLMKAFEMRAQDPTLKPADIVFITDGDCGFGQGEIEHIKQLKQKTEMRVYSIGIDYYSTRALELFSDQVAGVSLDGDVQIDLVKDLVTKTASQKVGNKT